VKHYGLTLSLRDNPQAINSYREHHRVVWPEVIAELRSAGVLGMKIFLLGRRMFMYLETTDSFEPERDFARLNENPRYAEWDELMRTMQERVAEARPDEWWSTMEEVFNLDWPRFSSADGLNVA